MCLKRGWGFRGYLLPPVSASFASGDSTGDEPPSGAGLRPGLAAGLFGSPPFAAALSLLSFRFFSRGSPGAAAPSSCAKTGAPN